MCWPRTTSATTCSTSPRPITGRDATMRRWLGAAFPATLRMIPAAIRPIALKTRTLYEAGAEAQNSFSTVPVYPASEQRFLHRGHLGAELPRLDQPCLQQPQVHHELQLRALDA